MNDETAEKQVEIFVGSDYVIRINVDGICVMRIKVDKTTDIRVTGAVQMSETVTNIVQ